MATTKVTTDVIDMSGNAGGLTWVTGTTVQQPSGVIGEIREDTDTNRTLVYTDETGTSEWRNLKEEAVTVSYSAEYLVIAGGGGGGGPDRGGGGGAGGFLTGTKTLTGGTSYTIAVGPGGAQATKGTDSSITELSLTATGGGHGGYEYPTNPAGAGGSGGGGTDGNVVGSGAVGGDGNTPFTTPSQGYNGGTGLRANEAVTGGSVWWASGGGGGADAVGGNVGPASPGSGQAATGGEGGVGRVTTIINTTMSTDASVGQVSGGSVYFSGGASGNRDTINTTDSAPGGLGGGGKGAWGNGSGPNQNNPASAGGPNTGGGGGGGNWGATIPGLPGGTGVVILKVPTATIGTPTNHFTPIPTDGANSILIWKTNGTYTA